MIIVVMSLLSGRGDSAGHSRSLVMRTIASRSDDVPLCFIGEVPEEKLHDAGFVAISFPRMS